MLSEADEQRQVIHKGIMRVLNTTTEATMDDGVKTLCALAEKGVSSVHVELISMMVMFVQERNISAFMLPSFASIIRHVCSKERSLALSHDLARALATIIHEGLKKHPVHAVNHAGQLLAHMYAMTCVAPAIVSDATILLADGFTADHLGCLFMMMSIAGARLNHDSPGHLKRLAKDIAARAAREPVTTRQQVFVSLVGMADVPPPTPLAVRAAALSATDHLIPASFSLAAYRTGSYQTEEVNVTKKFKIASDEHIEALATELHCNTEARRQVCRAVMGAVSVDDAYERLAKMPAVDKRHDRDVVATLLNCAAHEKRVNEFYALLAVELARRVRAKEWRRAFKAALDQEPDRLKALRKNKKAAAQRATQTGAIFGALVRADVLPLHDVGAAGTKAKDRVLTLFTEATLCTVLSDGALDAVTRMTKSRGVSRLADRQMAVDAVGSALGVLRGKFATAADVSSTEGGRLAKFLGQEPEVVRNAVDHAVQVMERTARAAATDSGRRHRMRVELGIAEQEG